MRTGPPRLTGLRVLVVEDEYFIAQDVRRALEADGATVVGPVATAGQALTLIDAAPPVDAAVLDVSLNAERDAYPVAEALTTRDIPFVFATGYDQSTLRSDFAAVPTLGKPFDLERLCQLLAGTRP